VHCRVRFWVMPMPTLWSLRRAPIPTRSQREAALSSFRVKALPVQNAGHVDGSSRCVLRLLATEMLVQSRRKACSTCQARKTKVTHLLSLICSCILIISQCDRAEPACQQCLRAGWVCPGYPERWRIQERKSQKGHECKSESESTCEFVLL
jgi:hypothetical protein